MFGSTSIAISNSQFANLATVNSKIEGYKHKKPFPFPANLCWKYKFKDKEAGPSNGYFYKGSEYWRFSFISYNSCDLSWNKPSEKMDKTWNISGRADMRIWLLNESSSSNQWQLITHLEIDKAGWDIQNGDGTIRHFEMREAWKSHDYSMETNKIYYVSCGGFF